MALINLRALALAFPIVITALAPDSAEACPYGGEPCAEFDFWSDLAPTNAAKIPADGVLLLQGAHQGGDDSEWLAKLELTVTEDGQPIAGALETTSQHGLLVWRPAAPFTPGATYQLTGELTNPADLDDLCGPLTIPLAADLVIDADPGAVIGPVAFTAKVASTIVPQVSLATLACCPGAAPSEGYGGCGGTYVNWDEMECAPTAAHGYFSVEITGEPAATGPVADEILYTLRIDGMPHARSLAPAFTVAARDAPLCAVIEAEDLASGLVTVGPEQCFGADLVDELGPLPLDPADELTCELQQCAVVNGAWDPTQCTPFEPEPTGSASMSDTNDTNDTSDADGTPADGEKGCACQHAPADAAPLGLLGLLGLTRRRRARR